jgi:hypothetical protein
MRWTDLRKCRIVESGAHLRLPILCRFVKNAPTRAGVVRDRKWVRRQCGCARLEICGAMLLDFKGIEVDDNHPRQALFVNHSSHL